MNVLAATASQVALQQHILGQAVVIIGSILVVLPIFSKRARSFYRGMPAKLPGTMFIALVIAVIGAFLA